MCVIVLCVMNLNFCVFCFDDVWVLMMWSEVVDEIVVMCVLSVDCEVCVMEVLLM